MRPIDRSAAAVDKDTSWKSQANCRGLDPNLFYPERGASTREAKAVCRGCVVREQCLEYALADPPEKYGVWGGTSERERRVLRVERRRAAITTNVTEEAS